MGLCHYGTTVMVTAATTAASQCASKTQPRRPRHSVPEHTVRMNGATQLGWQLHSQKPSPKPGAAAGRTKSGSQYGLSHLVRVTPGLPGRHMGIVTQKDKVALRSARSHFHGNQPQGRTCSTCPQVGKHTGATDEKVSDPTSGWCDYHVCRGNTSRKVPWPWLCPLQALIPTCLPEALSKG